MWTTGRFRRVDSLDLLNRYDKIMIRSCDSERIFRLLKNNRYGHQT